MSKTGSGNTVPRGEAGLICTVLCCAAVLGLLLALRVPPMAGFDEPFHWRRAVQVSAGGWLATRLGSNDWGGSIDAGALDFEYEADRPIGAGRPLDEADMARLSARLRGRLPSRAPASFPSTGSFSPVAYGPAALGVAAARALRFGPLGQVRGGRLATLAAYLVLVRAVLALLPAGRLAALALLLTPTALHLASCFSADPLCLALPALLAAACLRLHATADRLPPAGWRWGLLALCVLVGLLKPIDFVASALLLLVPLRLFGSPAAGWRFRLLGMGACLGAALGWNLAFPFVPGRYWHTGADPAAAVLALRHAPLHAVRVLLGNAWQDRWFWWSDGWGRFGGGPGPFHFTVPAPLAAIALLGVAGLAVVEGDRPARPAAAMLLVAVAAVLVGLLLLAFRIGYGPPHSDFIDGVQGRYLLLPALLLALGVAMAVPRLRVLRRIAPVLVPVCVLACALPVLAAVALALGRYATLWH